MKLLDIIKELDTSKHFHKQNNLRFVYNDYLEVMLMNRNTKEFSKIGSFVIPQDIVDEIKNNEQFITNPDLKLDPGVVYAVLTYSFNVRDLWNEFNFDQNVYMKDLIYKLKSKNYYIYFRDPITKSAGFNQIAIFKGSKLITTYYSMTKNEEKVINKVRNQHPKDIIIFVEDPQNIEYYDDDVITNNF